MCQFLAQIIKANKVGTVSPSLARIIVEDNQTGSDTSCRGNTVRNTYFKVHYNAALAQSIKMRIGRMMVFSSKVKE